MVFTREQANVLTPSGFYRYFKTLTDSGVKVLDAYERTEQVHQRVHMEGNRKYNDYTSFHPQVHREKRKLVGL